MLDRIVECYPEESFLIADGFDKAVIGVEETEMRLIYSAFKCISILVEQGMTIDDAREYFDYNVSGSYMGEKSPIFCQDDF